MHSLFKKKKNDISLKEKVNAETKIKTHPLVHKSIHACICVPLVHIALATYRRVCVCIRAPSMSLSVTCRGMKCFGRLPVTMGTR